MLSKVYKIYFFKFQKNIRILTLNQQIYITVYDVNIKITQNVFRRPVLATNFNLQCFIYLKKFCLKSKLNISSSWLRNKLFL